MRCPTVALVMLAHAFLARSAIYLQSQNSVGRQFLDNFEHEAIDDPTHGRVTYVDEATALASNLTYASQHSFVIRADHTTVLSDSDPGRQSVRIRSKRVFTTHAVVMDIRHMPQGCATWPAAWETLESDWPASGEIDIVEGVNDVEPNASTLHTSSNCTMPETRSQTGTTVSTNCDVDFNYNAGCGVQAPATNSYGPAFNAAGGGWYAMERTNKFIKVWFWPRNSKFVPLDVYSGSPIIDTTFWGTPYASFPSTSTCDLEAKFGENNIIINLTLCGDWAGAVFTSNGCGASCTDYVNRNPAAFVDAYWDFARLSVYE
ncbi:endo-1,3(4)-beta-glucanase-like protein [Punctularia strigosozonata HHB-11173 SS5]|uniref:endo-1,3(4)-beta-glucanase-like protein n=1 Tax=Punctularia strigosozonata (strain HHB-11173) TaxID=741275 RepID=UPI00044166DE|nr:endo-1,3(4)-beta-glucanase-like protein [Punctularia strigosozonata HHB-11173 SS5]EIN06365.1 endo-1,3(4)-beta-glucanase-like protein [Punctularia strigosozonata HHB-11173 SS5]